MRVAVLGAPGRRAMRVTSDLLEHPEVVEVVLAGPAVADLASAIPASDPHRVREAVAPATAEGLADVLRAVDVVADCQEDPRATLAAFSAARAVGTPYLSSSEDAGVVAALLAARGTGSDAPAVVAMSWTPGVSNLLVALAAEDVSFIRSVRVAWFTSRDDEGADGLPRLRVAWSGAAEVIEAGVARSRPPGAHRERVFFPQPLGWQRVHAVRGAEVLTLPSMLPELAAMHVAGGLGGGSGIRVAGWAAGALESGAGSASRTPRRARLALQGAASASRALVAGLGPLGGRGPDWSALRVDVGGRAGGADRVATAGLVDHLLNLESAPVVVATLLLGRGDVRGGGVLAPEEAFAARTFLRLLGDRGVRVARLER